MFNQRFLAFSLILLFVVCVFGGEAYAVTNHCPRHQVKTELKAKKYKTKYLSGSLNDINGYLNSHSVLAFVQNPLSVKTYYDFSVKEIGAGRYCVMLDRVKAQYRSSSRIVMPANFKKSSCEYKIIRKHEQRHLDTHYSYFERSVGQYQVFLGRIARDVPVYKPFETAEEAERIKQSIMTYFDKKFYRRVNGSINELHKLQKKIDSVQEYTFTGRKIERCKDLEAQKKMGNKKTFYGNR